MPHVPLAIPDHPRNFPRNPANYTSFQPFMQPLAMQDYPENDRNQDHRCGICYQLCGEVQGTSAKQQVCRDHCAAHVCARPMHM